MLGALSQSESLHYNRVKRFNVMADKRGATRIVRETPYPTTELHPDHRASLLMIFLEEVMELVSALGFHFVIRNQSFGGAIEDLKDLLQVLTLTQSESLPAYPEEEIADALADVSVTSLAIALAYGIKDLNLHSVIDMNNLMKFSGRATVSPETKKLIKDPDHPKPDLPRLIQDSLSWDTNSGS